MYTRVYQGRSKELPEDYHGTAFARESEREARRMPLPADERQEEQEPERAQSEASDAKAAREEVPRAAREGERDEREADGGAKRQAGAWGTERDVQAFGAELLLLTICALLVESEAPDTRLLALLLLLLLSPT